MNGTTIGDKVTCTSCSCVGIPALAPSNYMQILLIGIVGSCPRPLVLLNSCHISPEKHVDQIQNFTQPQNLKKL